MKKLTAVILIVAGVILGNIVYQKFIASRV